MELLIFILTLWTAPGGNHHEPAVIPPDIALTIFAASRHHGQDPLEVASVVAAENEGREYHEREVGRYGGCKGAGCEAGIAQLKRVFQRLVNKRCNAKLRASHKHYKGRGDCLYIGSSQRVYRRLKSRKRDTVWYSLENTRSMARPEDPYALRADVLAKGGTVLRHRVGELRGSPKHTDLFVMRTNIEALVVGVEEMKRWQPIYAPKLECRWPDKSRKRDCWQPNFRCSPRAFAKDGSWVTKGCLRSVNRLLKWEWSLRKRHALLTRWAEAFKHPVDLAWNRVTVRGLPEETADARPQ